MDTDKGLSGTIYLTGELRGINQIYVLHIL